MDEKRTGAGPSGRAILLWGGGGVLLATALALFGLYFVAPALRARHVLALIKARDKSLYDDEAAWNDGQGWGGPSDPIDGCRYILDDWIVTDDSDYYGVGVDEVEDDLWPTGVDAWWVISEYDLPSSRALRRLGGAKKAARALSLYMMLPERYAPHKLLAVCLLGHCGKPAVPALLRALEHPKTRPWAARKLAEIGPGAAAVPALLAALKAEKACRTDLGTSPMPSPSPYSWPLPWATRCDIAEVVGLIGPAAKPAVPALVKLLDDEHLNVRVAAALALWRITGRTKVLVPAILKDYESGTYADEAIWEIGGEAVPYLLEDLQSKDAQRRKVAAWALACVRPEECKAGLEPLIAALGDGNAEVRGAAASTLGCFGSAASEALPVLEEVAAREKNSEAAQVMIWAMEGISANLPSATEDLRILWYDWRRRSFEALYFSP